MWRVIFLAIVGLQCIACSGGISSYEEGVEAQSEVMEEMLSILEGVTDEASAEAASSEIEALGNRLADIAQQFQELPEPTAGEIQEMQRRQQARQQDFQNRAVPQMMKLAQYKSLSDAWTRALMNMQ